MKHCDEDQRARSSQPSCRAGLFVCGSIRNHSLMWGPCLPHTCRGVCGGGVPGVQMAQEPGEEPLQPSCCVDSSALQLGTVRKGCLSSRSGFCRVEITLYCSVVARLMIFAQCVSLLVFFINNDNKIALRLPAVAACATSQGAASWPPPFLPC